MLAISAMHANLMRTFSMKIGGESHTRSQRSNLPDFGGCIPFRDESENDDFCTGVIIENGAISGFSKFLFHFENLRAQKTAISVLELIEDGTIFRIFGVSG